MPLTSEEIRHLASESAKSAVRELLVAMGVDANDPKSLLEMQEDFSHLRAWRKSTQAVKEKSLSAAVAFFVTGFLGYLLFLFTTHK